jgi:restriction system protein
VAKRRRTRTSEGIVTVLAVLAAVIVLRGLVALLDLVHAHPALTVSLAVLVIVGGTLWWLGRKYRETQQTQRQQRLDFARSLEIARYHRMGPSEFEEALAFLCARDGCRQAQAVGRAGDLGADVIAVAPDGRKIVLQAKRYGPATKVTGPDLQRFGGTCFTVHRAGVAAVVTTSTFTKQAREYAAHAGILLFDADTLGAWASRTGPPPWH